MNQIKPKHIAQQFELFSDSISVGITPTIETVAQKEIDWKSKVPTEFLYINSARKNIVEKKYGKVINDIKIVEDKVEDVDLIIKLGGIKHLLKLRGYNSVYYKVISASKEYAAVNCEITFSSLNKEDPYETIVFSENACAHTDNTTSFAKNYLLEIATNRAFCRTIRNFLNINIVSQEELGGTSTTTEEEPKKDMLDSKLESLMKENSLTFEKIKAKLVEENYIKLDDDKKPILYAKDLRSISDIDRTQKFKLIERIVKKLEAKESK